MKLPRCGYQDRVVVLGDGSSFNLDTKSRVKRFSLYGTRWNKKHLTYAVAKYASAVKSRVVDDELAAAFKVNQLIC